MVKDDARMLNCSDHYINLSVVRMLPFASSSTNTTLTLWNTAPFIPSDCDLQVLFERVLKYAGLGWHLSEGSADTNDDVTNGYSSESLANDKLSIGSALVTMIVKWKLIS